MEAFGGYGIDPELTTPTEVLASRAHGDIALDDASVDLVTCLGVLQYVPNVGHVLAEFARVLSPDGLLLLREPITTLGFGESHRGSGLTTHSRGAPLDYFRRQLPAQGFAIERETLTSFPGIGALWGSRIVPYNSRLLTMIDFACCRAVARRVRYYATNRRQKVRPRGVAIVARRV